MKLRENREITIEFLFPGGPDDFEHVLEEEGFTVHRPGINRLHPPRYLLKNIRYLGTLPTAVYCILNLIQRRDIDVVHVTSTMNIYPALAGWSEASVVWHFNGYNYPKSGIKTISLIAPTLADDFVFSSSIVREQIFDDDVGGTLIFPPVDLETFDPTTVEADGCLRGELGID